VIYDAQGRYDEAIRQFRAAENPRDDDPRIHFGMGIYDQRHGHIQEAIEEYQAAVRLGSQATHPTALAYILLAQAQEKAGHAAEAAAARAKAAELSTNLDEAQQAARNLLR
jgi:tetratricopeptide (TPR) repeat protein